LLIEVGVFHTTSLAQYFLLSFPAFCPKNQFQEG